MEVFVEAAQLRRLASGKAFVVTAGDRSVALFNVDGQPYAIEDTCVRCGASLAAGTLHGHEVACSGCDWRYDVRSGCISGVPALCIDTFQVVSVEPTIIAEGTATQGSGNP